VPWSRTVENSEAFQAVSQFLLREARWFKQTGH